MKIYKQSIVYILCPPKYATGGTELLHQLCDALLKIKIQAKIFYWPQVDNPTNEQFKEYKIDVALKIEDDSKNIFIAPEIDNYKIFEYEEIQKGIWWLSIDNHFKNIKIRKTSFKVRFMDFFLRRTYFDLNTPETNSVIHFAQSNYAKTFLQNKGLKNIELLSDYINNRFLEGKFDTDIKEDIILYNPKKGIDYTRKLIEFSKGKLNWIPIENLTRDGVFDLLKRAKVYVDFGNHPGKDRFPREAAASGCCVITNKKGSAGNIDDVSIPTKFKFNGSESDIPTIIDTLENCIVNYQDIILEFKKYREGILNEKDLFLSQVERNFNPSDR